MDIDDNGYPDLAVGSLSDSVQVYRLDVSYIHKIMYSRLIRCFTIIIPTKW